jgi:regulator of protease activity HflC (stomatin/prohibitin superfamily)
MNALNQEIERRSASGYPMLLLLLGINAGGIVALTSESNAGLITFGLLLFATLLIGIGFYMLQPNQAAVLTLFGAYRGSDRSQGLRWANPFYAKAKV